jgi:hypothetical protein
MDLDSVILSRVQFGFVVSFHIIFPAFTIGLAAWLAKIEGVHLATGNAVYCGVDFWLKVFALSFGMGVVSGIVMAFQFGTNWSVLAERTGPWRSPGHSSSRFIKLMNGSEHQLIVPLDRTAGFPLLTQRRSRSGDL